MLNRVLLFITFFIFFKIEAQDAQWSQYYNTPLYHNPAFAGTGNNTRAGTNYRVQWLDVSTPYNTFAVWGDHNIETAKSGIGFWLMRDGQGYSRLRSTEFNLSYSYQVELNRNWVFKPAIQVGFGVRDIDYYNAIFGDQLTNNGVSGAPTFDPLIQSPQSKVYPDFGTGGLLYNNHTWFSFAIAHINNPNNSFDNTKGYYIPAKFQFNLGYKFDLNPSRYATKEFSITPTALFKTQGNYFQSDIGAYLTYDPIILGLWYRGLPFISNANGFTNRAAIIPSIGVMINQWQLQYSYDINISDIKLTQTGGTHEISLIYEFRIKYRNAKVKKSIPCPNLSHRFQ
jgi:type IX secretion system PorP/SprF family membrane protein